MPVVEKIESMGYEVNIGSNVVIIYDKNGSGSIETFASTKIQATYQAIITFVSEIRD
jgi:hypothetical protein